MGNNQITKRKNKNDCHYEVEFIINPRTILFKEFESEWCVKTKS